MQLSTKGWEIGTVTYEEFLTWPEKYQNLWNAVRRSRENLWVQCIPEWVEEQITVSCDDVASFIREELRELC